MKPYYQNEFATIYHADSLENPKLWASGDVMVTDPPYGIRWKSRPGGYSNQARAGHFKAHKIDVVKGDTGLEVRDEALNVWGKRPGIVFGAWKKERPENTWQRLIWYKKGSKPGPLNAAFMSNDEEIYIIGGGAKDGWKKSSPPLRSVIETSEDRSWAVRRAGHPTPKPLDLMVKLIERCPDGVIVDPFMGAGATLIAAQSLSRVSVGIEIEEKYCEIAAKRLEEMSVNV